MVKVAIGTMVLCHLISTGGPTTEGEEKIFKLLGTIIEINTGKVPKIYEDVERRVAYRVLGDELLIRAKDGSGIYQVDANACMLVKESTDKEVQEAFKGRKTIENAGQSLKEEISEAKDEAAEAIEKQNRPTVQEATSKVSEIVERNLIHPQPTVKPKDEVKKEAPKVSVPKEEILPPPKVEPVVQERKEEVVMPMPTAPVVREEVKKEEPKKEEKPKGLMDYLLE